MTLQCENWAPFQKIKDLVAEKQKIRVTSILTRNDAMSGKIKCKFEPAGIVVFSYDIEGNEFQQRRLEDMRILMTSYSL